MINNNRQLKEWPSATIVKAISIDNTMPDNEPYAQKLVLSCGHWLVNTWGNQFQAFNPGESLKCRACAINRR